MRDLIASGYGISLVAPERVQVGAGAKAETFRGTDADGRSFFIKHRIGHDPGVALSSALLGAGNSRVLARQLTVFPGKRFRNHSATGLP